MGAAKHPAVACALSDLALLYLEQGHLAEAGTLQRRSTKIPEHAMGAYHPELATALGNFALVASAQGKAMQSESLLRRAQGRLRRSDRVITQERIDEVAGYLMVQFGTCGYADGDAGSFLLGNALAQSQSVVGAAC